MNKPTIVATLLALSSPALAVDEDYLNLLFRERQHVQPAVFGALNLGHAKFSRASWYGGGERLNRHAANGEVFNPRALTAAHRTLPFGTRVAVSYGGRTVVVRVNDRGPAKWTGRDLDLSREAARRLGYIRGGEARVTWAIVGMPGARNIQLADASGWLARDTISIMER